MNKSTSKLKSVKDDNTIVSVKSSLQKPKNKLPSSKLGSQDPKTARTPVPAKTKIIDANIPKPGQKAKDAKNSKVSLFTPSNPISESKQEHEEDKHKEVKSKEDKHKEVKHKVDDHKEIKNKEVVNKEDSSVSKDKIDPNDLEVFSDFSYDKSTDIDLPTNLKSVTCTTEIVKTKQGREMVIRKQYYLHDGRELRVKNIRPIKNKK